jgi:hypothetical protein
MVLTTDRASTSSLGSELGHHGDRQHKQQNRPDPGPYGDGNRDGKNAERDGERTEQQQRCTEDR